MKPDGRHPAVPAGRGAAAEPRWLLLLRDSWGVHRGLTVLCLMGAAAFVLMLMTVFGEQGVFKVRRLRQDRALLGEKIAGVEREIAVLQSRAQTLKSGPAPYEKAAREQLGLVRPGEIVYDFRPDPLSGR